MSAPTPAQDGDGFGRGKPILFSGPMVRALLDGRKTQTRRIAKFVETTGDDEFHIHQRGGGVYGVPGWGVPIDAPAFAPIAIGDCLWVREAHYKTDDGDYERAVCAVDDDEVREHLEAVERLKVSHPHIDWSRHARLRPGIHMPRWASRLTLTVTDVRVQRLQDITWEDAEAEGVWHASQEYREQVCIWRDAPSKLRSLRVEHFAKLWGSINGPDSWTANPWVAAYTFTVEHRNIDAALSKATGGARV